MKKSIFNVGSLLLLFLSISFQCNHLLSSNVECQLKVDSLKCEYQVNPLGIDITNPRLSWTMQSDARSQTQSAYQVIVSTSLDSLTASKADQWNSRKVQSGNSIQVTYSGPELAPETRYYWRVRIWDQNDTPSAWSEPAWFETAILHQHNWQAKWLNDGKTNPAVEEDFFKFDPAPLFRKDFTLTKPVSQARLYITGLGYYEASLNGKRIGDHLLDPGWTDFSKRIYYSTYDLTDRLTTGGNCLGVTLGNGWFNPLPLRMWGHLNIREHLTVGRPQFIAQLKITYKDGSEQLITSDTGWKVTEGPIIRNSIYLGEIYDARKELAAWNMPGFDDSAWHNAALADSPAPILQAQPLLPIRSTAVIKPVSVTEIKDGVYIVDMGCNFAGLASFKFNLKKSAMVKMRYGELLYNDGTLNPMTSVCGQIKGKRNDSLQANPGLAWQEDIYFAKGSSPEIYTPRFTFHAFRYIEITGLPQKPELDSITGYRLNTDVTPVGSFSCSNDLFNSIQQICQTSFLSNIFSVQSDCPHRERFGYGGDLVNTNEAFIYNYDMANFYAKAVQDWDDCKLADGMLTDTAPFVGIQYCGVGWAMAHLHTQLVLYRYYGDLTILQQQYDTAVRWFDLVINSNPDFIVNQGLSDHETLTENPAPTLVTPLYFQCANMLAQISAILGKNDNRDKYLTLADNIMTAYNGKFFDTATGKCGSGTQSSQSFALYSDILPQDSQKAAFQYLLDRIKKCDNHLSTGIFGTNYMLDILSRQGSGELAYTIVNQRTFPGWGHMLESGATSLWEHWQFSDNTYSHNHPMFGSVSKWFYSSLGGIKPDPQAVGFDKIIINPLVLKQLQWVKSTYNSVRGPITSNWHKSDNEITFDITIPANTTATVYLPSDKLQAIKEGGKPVTAVSDIKLSTCNNGVSAWNIGSGSYHFTIPCK